jgi:hypothetical protein
MKANKLNYCAIDIKPITADWSIDYGETWEYHASCRCEECGQIIVGRGGEKHCDLDDESKCKGYVPTNEGPMMNYYYPLPEFEHAAGGVNECARLLADLPLCLVEFTEEGEYAPALTGGGMELSWEICEAFMHCGYFPPAHFCDLPQMTGRGESARDRRIISACRQSLRGIKSRAVRSLQRLAQNFKRTA